MIRAIIFDFFDVIRADGFHKWLKDHGNSREGKLAEASKLLDKGQISTEKFFQLLGEATGQSPEQVQHEMETDVPLIDGTVKIVSELHGHYKLALLSNAESNYLREQISTYNLEQYFDLIVVSSEVGMAKPEPEIFDYILKKLELPASDVVFIDDNPSHIQSAKNIGINGLVFTTPEKLRADLQEQFSIG